jgi:TonB family protein
MNTDIIIPILRVVTGTGILYLLYVILLKKQLAGNFSRLFILTGTLIFSVLPFIGLFTAAPIFSDTVYLVTLPDVIFGNNITEPSLRVNWGLLLYLIPVVILFLILCWKLFKVFKLNKTGITHTSHGVSYTETNAIRYPFSFGSRIYIPTGMDESSKKLVIEHETVHIRHFHTIDVLFFEALKIVAWFNPFYFLLEKEIRQTHEFTADEIILRNGTSTDEYCEALLSCALVGMKVPVNYFNGSQIKTRIYMMNKQKNVRKAAALFVAATGMLVGIYATTPNLFGQSTAKAKTAAVSEPDKMPEYPGGNEAMMKFMAENIKYPKDAIKNNVQGKVFINFIVAENGDVTDAKVKRGIGSGCDEEALRVVKIMPRWISGEKNGKPVSAEMSLPISFKLN